MIGRALTHGCRRSPLSSFIIKSISCSALRRELHHTSNAHGPQINHPSPSSSSLYQSNILRILRNEIQHHYAYAPPHQPASEFDRFTVEDRPGEQWITLRGKSDDNENIKIEATMFDGSIIASKSGEESTEENVQLHISVLVDIWKGEGTELMEFVCSACPESLEIQKVYIFRRDASLAQPYIGPDIKNLNTKLRTEFYKFLKRRGVDNGLSRFLHEYMMNKDKIELIGWLGKVHSYFKN